MQDTTVQTPVEPVFEFQYKLGARTQNFNREDIVALHASQKYTEVVLRNSAIRPIWDESLKTLMDDDRFKHDFVYAHRATLVRIESVFSVDRVLSTSSYIAVLDATDGEPASGRYYFRVSRRYYANLRRRVVARNALTATA